MESQQIKKINLLNLNYKQLSQFIKNIGEKRFRANQIMKWIYHDGCTNFDMMTNINKLLQQKLKQKAEIRLPQVVSKHTSSDGTIKWIMSINKQKIETVYIPEKSRSTLCISSQAGCILNCKFCSTGQQGFAENLKTAEIIGQILYVKQFLKIEKKSTISNVVMMGMGEPLLNLNNVVTALQIMLDKLGFNISKRRITVSTAGIPPGINRLGNLIDVVLAISLHAPNNEVRDSIMPINKKYNIQVLLESVQKYIKKSKANRGKVTIEYVMLKNVNDRIKHAEELAKLLKDTPSKINLIPWNPFKSSEYKTSPEKQIKTFAAILKKHGLFTTTRKERGLDINAACGQLVGDIHSKNRKIKKIQDNTNSFPTKITII